MKSLLFVAAMALVSSPAISQCNPFFNFKKGASWEMESFNAKGKSEGSSRYEVVSFEKSAGDYQATVALKVMDKKEKELMDSELELKCEGGVLHYDMRKFFPKESMAAYSDMDAEMTGDNLEYPSDLSVGDELKDAKLTMSISGEGMPFKMNFTMEIMDRKVEAKESITTAAGTFECYKITSTMNMKTVRNFRSKGIEWIAPGKGVVRTESYNGNGKMLAYSELKSFND